MRRCEINGSGASLFAYQDNIILKLGYSAGQAFALVYSVDSRESFDRVKIWFQIMKLAKKFPEFIVVGNKCDREQEREVLKAEGAALARSFGCPFMETSAKTSHNVEHLFTSLVRLLRAAPPTDVTRSSRIAIERQKPLKSKKCYIF